MTQNSHEPPEWKRELDSSIRSLDAMQSRFPAMVVTAAMRRAADLFPMSVTPYYAELVQRPEFDDPVFAQCAPDGRELQAPSWLSSLLSNWRVRRKAHRERTRHHSHV